MKPEKLTIEEAAQAIKIPVENWPGNCYAIALAIVKARLVQGTAVYGHWLGPIAKDSHFARRRGLPFCNHGWVLLKDGRILDPTRWVFEAAVPYLHIGPGDAPEYDEGGNMVRDVLTKPAPPWQEDAKPANLTLPKRTQAHVAMLLGDAAGKNLTMEQVFWLANLPYDRLQPHAATIYGAIKKIGRGALIPIDNQRRAERERA